MMTVRYKTIELQRRADALCSFVSVCSTVPVAVQFTSRMRESVPYVGEQLLNFRFQRGRQGQERQPSGTAIVTVEVHSILKSGDAEVANALCRLRDSFLLEMREFRIAFLPRSVDLVASS